MPISYNQTVNDLTVVGYSEAAPCSFADLHNADLAAVNGRTLLSGVAPGSPWTTSLTSQPQPCEHLAVALNLSCPPRPGATAVISGTDAWGAPQSETLNLSTGTATTSLRFRTVNANGLVITGLSNGDSFAVSQNRWGVVWRFGNIFIFDARITVGDDTIGNKGHLADVKKTLIFNSASGDSSSYSYCIQLKKHSYLRLGEVVSEAQKTTKNGCTLINLKNLSGTFHTLKKNYATDITVNLYDCTFRYEGPSSSTPLLELRCTDSDANVRVWHCHLSSTKILQSSADKGDFFDLIIDNADNGFGGGGLAERLSLHGQTQGSLYFSGASRTIRNAFSRGAANLVRAYNFANTGNILDADTDTWTMSWSGSSGRINRQYSLDLTVHAASGAPLAGAVVTLTNGLGSTVINQTTGADGAIPTQTVTRGYYEQASGSTLQDYGPHTLTITREGYETYQDVLNLTAKTSLSVSLLPARPPLYIPTPAETFFIEIAPSAELLVKLSAPVLEVALSG